jgi:uroporphyrinogen decarboxylase
MATVMGTEFDKRPFTGTLGLYGARLTGCPLKRYYTESSEYLDGISAVVENINPDIIFSPLFLPGFGEAFGSEVRYFDDQAPNLKIPSITDLNEISKLKVPDIDSAPQLIYTREIVRGMKKKYGKEKLIGAVFMSPAELPVMITGLENWLPAVVDKTDHVKKMLDITIPFFIKFAKALISDGMDLLALPAAFTLPNILTRHIVKQYALPVLKEAFSEIEVPIFLHHTGALYNEFLDLLTDLPNVTGFVVDARDSLPEAREKAGKSKVLMSGINGPDLNKYTREEIREITLQVLEERAADPHFIFTLAAADVPYNTPIENITAVPDAIKEFYEGSKL